MLRRKQAVDEMIHMMIADPLGLFQRAHLRESQFIRDFLRPEIFRRDRDQAPAELEILKSIVQHGLTALRHDPLPLCFRRNPVRRKADAIPPVDPVVADDPDQPAHRPDAAGKRPGLFEVTLCRLDVGLRVGELLGRIHPRQPLAQRRPVRVDDREERRGILRLELPQFEAGIYQVAKHGEFLEGARRVGVAMMELQQTKLKAEFFSLCCLPL